MPDCGECGEDELGMISADYTLCYNCGLEILKNNDGHPTHQNIITRLDQ